MRELTQLLELHDDSVPLDVATLQLATIEYPEVTADPFLGLLDSHANELGERVEGMSDGEEFVGAMNEYFFDELGFEGNRADYYDPANSCLNEVLTRRKGIPITLSVVCMEVARRLERPLFGIALPGHFILEYNDGEFCAVIDPFNAGQLLCESELLRTGESGSRRPMHDKESLLDPAANHQIVVRMLNNLAFGVHHAGTAAQTAQGARPVDSVRSGIGGAIPAKRSGAGPSRR